ncbi:hypothetical protein HWV62_20140 [Athelia sp. TMB]|nr:hypothetical protein HWV62_20140 [Athelia sp. TMB]
MDGSNDGDTLVIPKRASKNPESNSFDINDAFSDGDSDHEDQPQFDFSASVRDEIARNLSWIEAQNDSDMESAGKLSNGSGLQDTSISTIDIGGPASVLDSQSTADSSRSLTPDDSIHSKDFSQISLSEDAPPEREPSISPAEHGPEDVDASEQYIDHPYPTVHIDVSESTPRRAQAAAEQRPRATSNLDLPRLPSEDHMVDIPRSAPANSFEHPFDIPRLPASPVPAAPTKAPPGHRPTRSMGPSALEKVISKTRPTFLPPKNKQEDNRHMADWQKMMKMSRAAEEKRQAALQRRRLARERNIEESLHIWERDIVPDWRVVHKNPALRKLWWGGIPTKLRASMWEKAVGNALALSKDNYKSCFARAKRALNAGTFPPETLTLMESDILNTLPSLHIFHPLTGPLYQDLKDMLCAWVVSRTDEGLGYTFGIAKLAAMLLINMPVQQGFVVLRNLLERHCMRSFYGGASAKDDQHQISPAAYLRDWLLPLFLDHLPFEACARIWDVVILEGDAFLYRTALAILATLESRLFYPDRQELLAVLKGESRPALEVAKRDGRTLDGGKYEIYDVDEETVWERIDSMAEWWKESTWNRLIQRELPDLWATPRSSRMPTEKAKGIQQFPLLRSIDSCREAVYDGGWALVRTTKLRSSLGKFRAPNARWYSRSRDKTTGRNSWKNYGSYFCRVGHAYYPMEALIRQALSDLDEEEWESLQQRREYIASQILLVMTCEFESNSQIDVCEIAEKMEVGRKQAIQRDVKHLKNMVPEWIIPGERLKNIDEKPTRGFNHEKTGALLCPINLDWSDSNVRSILLCGDLDLANFHWPRFLYAEHADGPNTEWRTFLRSNILVEAYKYLLFTTPLWSMSATASKEVSSVRNIFNISHVCATSLAYIAAQVYFALSSASQWRGWTGYIKVLYDRLLDTLEDPRFNKEVGELLDWWNGKFFPVYFDTPLARIRARREAILARERAEKAKENDDMQASLDAGFEELGLMDAPDGDLQCENSERGSSVDWIMALEDLINVACCSD